MTHWYYVAGDRQRRGPVDAAAIDGLFRAGQIHLDTLVWRDGLPQWRALGEVAGELGLSDTAGGALPPPLPPAAPVQVAPSAPPRSGLSGCMIALVVGVVVAVPMLAILAAIALPAYNDYTLRARMSAAVAAAEPLKPSVAAYVEEHSGCPGNGEPGFGTPESYAGDNVASIVVGEFETGLCGMELRITGTGNEHLDDKALWLEYDPDGRAWTCSSEIDDKYLPNRCRG
jgi:type IV pilus assembly protein PilA